MTEDKNTNVDMAYEISTVPQYKRDLRHDLDDTVGDRFFDMNTGGSSPTPSKPNVYKNSVSDENKENAGQQKGGGGGKQNGSDGRLSRKDLFGQHQRRSAAQPKMEKKNEVVREAKLPVRRSVDVQAKNDQTRDVKQRPIPLPKKPEPAILPVRRSAIDNDTPKVDSVNRIAEQKPLLLTARRSDNPSSNVTHVPTPLPRTINKRASSVTVLQTTTAIASSTQARLAVRRSSSNPEQKHANEDFAKKQLVVQTNAAKQEGQAIPNVVPRLHRPPQRNAAIAANKALTKNLAGPSKVTAGVNNKSLTQTNNAVNKNAPSKNILNVEPKKQVQKLPVRPATIPITPNFMKRPKNQPPQQPSISRPPVQLVKRARSVVPVQAPPMAVKVKPRTSEAAPDGESVWDRLSKPKYIRQKVIQPNSISRIGVSGVPTPMARNALTKKAPLIPKETEA